MSGERYVLDTNVLMHLIRGDNIGQQVDRDYGLTTSEPKVFLSVVTHGEILVLAAVNQWGQTKKKFLKRALRAFPAIYISDKIVKAYVKIDKTSRNLGAHSRKMGKNDLWIAASAKVSDSILLTTDKDFDHLPATLVKVEVIDLQSLASGHAAASGPADPSTP